MVKASRSGISQSKLYTLHATLKTAFAGLWRITQGRPSSQEILSSTEVGDPAHAIFPIEPCLTIPTGCGRFFEGTAEEMHTALNKTLSAVPDETKVYVRSPNLEFDII